MQEDLTANLFGPLESCWIFTAEASTACARPKLNRSAQRERLKDPSALQASWQLKPKSQGQCRAHFRAGSGCVFTPDVSDAIWPPCPVSLQVGPCLGNHFDG